MHFYCVLARSFKEEAKNLTKKGRKDDAVKIINKPYKHWEVALGLLKEDVLEKFLSKKIIFFIQNRGQSHWTFTAIFNLRSYFILTERKL